MWHPDKHKGDNDVTSKFQEINEAYTGTSQV
jgi:curved DNA-binding protein CbpA